LISEASKYNPNIFHFGDDASKVFMHALNAQYFEDADPEFSFNPLKMDDTASNREFLKNWLSLLIYNGDDMPVEDEPKLDQIISANYSLPLESRKISNIVSAIANSNQADSFAEITKRLAVWHSGGVYAKYFDNENDNFKPGQIIGFNLQNIHKDPQLAAAVVYYLIHRCTYLVNGKPSIFAFDNAINIWSHKFMIAKLKPWLGYLDKMSSIAIFAGEDRITDPEHEINKFLRTQITTLLIMANDPDKVKIAQVPGFERKITNILLDMKLINRQFYIQQGDDKILAELNLTGLDEVLKVLSANKEQLQHFQDVISKAGDNANVWLPLYYQTP
jgi:type IV secretion system protein VirB4